MESCLKDNREGQASSKVCRESSLPQGTPGGPFVGLLFLSVRARQEYYVQSTHKCLTFTIYKGCAVWNIFLEC